MRNPFPKKSHTVRKKIFRKRTKSALEKLVRAYIARTDKSVGPDVIDELVVSLVADIEGILKNQKQELFSSKKEEPLNEEDFIEMLYSDAK